MDGALITEADWQQAVPASDELYRPRAAGAALFGRGLKQPDAVGQFSVRYPAAKDLLQRRQRVWAALKAIGDEFGPVDLAIMENGQYDQDWKYIPWITLDETGSGCRRSARSRGAWRMQDDSFWRKQLG